MTTDTIPLDDPEKVPTARRVLEFLGGTLTIAVMEALSDSPDGAKRCNDCTAHFRSRPSAP